MPHFVVFPLFLFVLFNSQKPCSIFVKNKPLFFFGQKEAILNSAYVHSGITYRIIRSK